MSVFFFNDPAPTEIYTLSLHTLFRSGLRPSDARNGQERGSARCQLQTLTARKLHSVLLLFQACETHAPEWPLFRERDACASFYRGVARGSCTTSTAAPLMRPSRRRASASFARSSGKVSTEVLTGTLGASARNSSPSRRVRLATDTTRRSPHRIA